MSHDVRLTIRETAAMSDHVNLDKLYNVRNLDELREAHDAWAATKADREA